MKAMAPYAKQKDRKWIEFISKQAYVMCIVGSLELKEQFPDQHSLPIAFSTEVNKSLSEKKNSVT
jgi:hypothetical protein